MTPLEKGATTVPTISGRGCCSGLGSMPTPSSRSSVLLGGDVEPSALAHERIRWLALPDGGDDVDGFGEHLIAVLVEDAERLGVRGQRARADAEDEAAVGEVVEHRGVRRDQHRVLLREVRGAGAELDLFGLGDQRRQEHQAVGDVLVAVGEVFADERVVEAETVGEQHRLPVLAERLRPVPAGGVQGHGEVAESHQVSPMPQRSTGQWRRPRIHGRFDHAIRHRGRRLTGGVTGRDTLRDRNSRTPT